MPGITYIERLQSFLKDTTILEEDLCLVGSSVLADFNLRENNDLDIAITPEKRNQIDNSSLPDRVEISVEKYSWMNITDDELITDSRYHYWSNGFKIVRPEIETCYKHQRRKTKDKKDISLIEDYFLESNDSNYNWDWELFNYEYYPKKRNKCGFPESEQTYSLIARFEEHVRRNGTYSALSEVGRFTLSKVENYTPSILYPDTNDQDNIIFSDDNALYFIIWPTAEEITDLIKSHIDNEIGVISVNTCALGDDMGDFIFDIYDYNDHNRLIHFKKHRINRDGNHIFVVKTKAPMLNLDSLDKTVIVNMKEEIRKHYYPYVPSDSFHNMLHGPESLEENEWVIKILDKYGINL